MKAWHAFMGFNFIFLGFGVEGLNAFLVFCMFAMCFQGVPILFNHNSTSLFIKCAIKYLCINNKANLFFVILKFSNH